jgi:hypothetical protein
MRPLDLKLKQSCERAFHDNSLLVLISPEDRETAAQWYEEYAPHTIGKKAEIAFLYNLERARFLRGQVSRIARSAPDFEIEIGGGNTGGTQ